MTKRTILFLYQTYRYQYQNQNNAQNQDANQSRQQHYITSAARRKIDRIPAGKTEN